MIGLSVRGFIVLLGILFLKIISLTLNVFFVVGAIGKQRPPEIDDLFLPVKFVRKKKGGLYKS